ncbi:hypothetical protein [Puia sp.]|uniref:hypothetical protein n=1 Tax=Puia sp. TaxID=2045100 RepID=UPI002F41F6AE
MSNNANANTQYARLIISGILFIWTLSIFLPGAYSIDSWNQFNEVTGGRYDDWYGTGMVITWRRLWLLTGSFMSLFVAQMVLYWTFFTALLWTVRLKNPIYWLTMGLALFFCFIPQYVMRDSLMVLAWGLAALFLLYAANSETRRRTLTILGLLFFAYGLWVRINTLIAILPLAYVCVLFLGGSRLAIWKQALITLGGCIVLFLGSQFMTYRVQKAAHTYPEYKLKLLDLTGISKMSGENYFPEAIRNFPGFNLDTLYRRYTPADLDEIYWPEDGKRIFPYPTDSINSSVTRSWLSAIRHHPWDYFQNRFTGFIYYLHLRKRLGPMEYWNVSAFWIQPNGPLPVKMEPTKLKERISNMYLWFYPTILFDPWLWLLFNLAGFAFFFYKCRKEPGDKAWLVHACVQLSGVFFILSQLLIYQHDRDFRYSYWSVFVVFLAIPGIFGVRSPKKAGAKRQGAGVSPTP